MSIKMAKTNGDTYRLEDAFVTVIRDTITKREVQRVVLALSDTYILEKEVEL